MDVSFEGVIWYWRGPSPYHFVTVPEEISEAILASAAMVTYGWGMIPVTARVGKTDFRTSLFRHGDTYVVPMKVAVRRAEDVELDDVVAVQLHVDI